MAKTLEQYLKENIDRGVIDFSIRAQVASKGEVSLVSFYIHPTYVSGETADYEVAGNSLAPKYSK